MVQRWVEAPGLNGGSIPPSHTRNKKWMHVRSPWGTDHRRMVKNGGSNPAASTNQVITNANKAPNLTRQACAKADVVQVEQYLQVTPTRNMRRERRPSLTYSLWGCQVCPSLCHSVQPGGFESHRGCKVGTIQR